MRGIVRLSWLLAFSQLIVELRGNINLSGLPKGLQDSQVIPFPENYTLDSCVWSDLMPPKDANPWKRKMCSTANKSSASGQINITTEFTWAEFMQEYQDKENQGPELDILRRLFPLPDTLIPKQLYFLLLRVASDGTLIDLVNRHNSRLEYLESLDPDDDNDSIKTAGLVSRIKGYAREYLRKIKQKPYFTLFDYFEDVYKHQFHEWTWQCEQRRKQLKKARRERRREERKEKRQESGGPGDEGLREVILMDEEDIGQEIRQVFVGSTHVQHNDELLLEVQI
jgi:hypothetical protein